ncbi:ribosomal protein S12 methylthiotransferase accessory factor [Georgenia satyanarayanai]|uniref:Ribosomal protein S12 methylthiotransferase accessory factor n=1 Tax=Georgenia satyanarayanai TaxID=860221 RepID=A0A2Y9A490_9MICO|nr:TOMM precursor leader peptide-binding protein [Georgenia satyanarayanai]PYG02194.1 ribosomal protein S12 methylthiotransferase accessory factor [Georgenia satyanarayanai]SSA37027.1 ribosomal protein S12 methylthiotransferase accessory factor [Georgenia satyanarayanai]
MDWATDSTPAGAGGGLRLAPGLDVVPLGQDLLLATATARLRLEGEVAQLVRDRLVPTLTDLTPRRTVIAAFPDAVADDVGRLLDTLLDAGIVIEDDDGVPHPPWVQLVTASAEERRAVAERARTLRVAVVGNGEGARALTTSLTAAGIGGVRLLDLAAGTVPDRDGVTRAVAGSDLAVTAVDPELSAVRMWVNAAGLEHDVPSLHVAWHGTRAVVGPLVLPGEGPCYLCWRMRALACEDDFAAAMAHEEMLDRARQAPGRPRPVLPALLPGAAAVVTREVLAAAVGVYPARLPGHVLTLDGTTGSQVRHPVLQRPDCAACRKKDHRPSREQPPLATLAGTRSGRTDFDRIAARTVSPVSGLVRVLDAVTKDVEEPELPVVVRAELANARFQSGPEGFVGCSGKGATVEAARNGALGEALERYASLTWEPDRRVSATRDALDGPSLDPRDLVLFAEDQYADLPFRPYSARTELEWVPARSLTTGAEVWVPLLAVHLGYDVHHHDSYLFPATSNGFAAGATLTDAVRAGLLEVVERDAFLIAWAHRLAGRRSPAASVPDDVVRRVAAGYARRGVSIDVHQLPTDTAVTVVMAVGWSAEAPAAVVGLGADLDPVAAARGAVLEVGQVRPALRARLRRPGTAARLRELVADPARVTELEDHDLLYADPATAAAGLGYLREAPSLPWDATAPQDTGLTALVSSLTAVAGDVLYVDTTPPDVAELGVSVARGIVPGFQPIHFGAAQNRLGGERLHRMPADLGLVPRVAGREDLNLTAHPLA